MNSDSDDEGLGTVFTTPVSNKSASSSHDPNTKQKKTINTTDGKKTMSTNNRKRYRGLELDLFCQYNEASYPRVPLNHNEIIESKFGSVTKEMQRIIARRDQILEEKRYEAIEFGSSTPTSVSQNRQESVKKDPFATHLLEQVNCSRFGSDLDNVMQLISRIKEKRQCLERNSPLKCKSTDSDQGSTKDSMESNQLKTPHDIISNDHKNAISEERRLSLTRHYLNVPIIILDSSDDEDIAPQKSINNCALQDFKDNDGGECEFLAGEAKISNEDDRITSNAEEQSANNEVKIEKVEIGYDCEDKTPDSLVMVFVKGVCADLDRISYDEEEKPVNVVETEKEKPVNVVGIEKEKPVNVVEIEKEKPINVVKIEKEKPINVVKIEKENPISVVEIEKEKPVSVVEIKKEKPVNVVEIKKEMPVNVVEIVKENPVNVVEIEKEKPVNVIEIEKEKPVNVVEIEKENKAYLSKEGENGTKAYDEDDIHTGIDAETRLEVCNCSDEEIHSEVEGEQDTKQISDEDSDAVSIWMEMGVGMESSKDTLNLSTNGSPLENEDCEHSLIFKDDIGYVCRICGLVQQPIEKIIEYQPKKATRSRNYWREGGSSHGETNVKNRNKFEPSLEDLSDTEIYPHPRHGKQMKPHQVEGFNFLVRNLMTETPGGCILAHAPGSGKTFMIISFLQSFMAKHPSARPLVVLPRGIISTWKHEFKRWQVESFPLYDLYSVKAEIRSQQLGVLQDWAQNRSILFLGYVQFSSIVCDFSCDEVSTECQDILLSCPSILILDEGHTPRNRETDILISLEKVQTPRKVVLSGTLFQNHVEEVFNVLNLVRPKFLKMASSKSIKRRILSRAPPSKNRNLLKKCSDKDFYNLVETTILKDENFERKVGVIRDLRDMTREVLHYYKGDYLDELPGLVDFTVHLKLSPRQEKEAVEIENLGNMFKIISEGSVLYVHPQLKNRPRGSGGDDEENIDEILDRFDVNDGVKAKFFLNLLQLCESTGEKLLVFSQYLLPLKFLERLAIRVKKYSFQKEIFMITGDSDSELRESSMDRFNNSADARVFFGSIKACGEGISLVGASRVIILDVHLNPSVTRQAIGRAFRPGQKRKVYIYRLIAHNTHEVDNHKTCFKKESIAKLWFEWNESYGDREYEMETIDLENCGDMFLESPKLNQDVHSLFKR